jgi:glycosyltransferase involved in cell wall biosynthesis
MSITIDAPPELRTDADDTKAPWPAPERSPYYRITGRERRNEQRRARPTVSVIIPTLNEARNLPHVLGRLPEVITEVIVVDGHSTDETIRVAQALRPDARIILQDRKGKGNALACGFAAANGDIIVMIDADGSTDPAEIPDFIAPLADGAEFVKGSRHMTGGGSADITFVRSAGNRMFSLAVNMMFGTQYTDLCYGYSAFWRRCLPNLQITCDGFEVETILNVRAAKAGFRILEVPSFEQERIYGLSNLSAWKDGTRVLKAIVSERLSRLPEPSDDWIPQFAEMTDGMIQVSAGRGEDRSNFQSLPQTSGIVAF